MTAVSWHAVNIDSKTIAAMGGAYALEWNYENSSDIMVDSILSHYKNAGVAIAGIYVSKKNDYDAMRKPGLMASEENYYFKRTHRLVGSMIMPKLIVVASKLIKYPENVLKWGPKLYEITNNVENLCKEFEVVVTNGRLSFKDIRFLVISDQLQKLFNLAKLGDVDWKKVFDDLADFGGDLSEEELKDDLKDFGSAIASAGKQTKDINLRNLSRIGKAFHSSANEVMKIYDKYKEAYKNIKNGIEAKKQLLAVIKTTDAAGVAKLFQADDYSIEGFISNYLKDDKDQYYTQRWYIYTEDKGTKVLCDYQPETSTSWNIKDWTSDWITFENRKDKINEHHTLSEAEKKDLKDKASSICGWSEQRVKEYNKNNPGHNCTILYTLNHEDRIHKYKTGANTHRRNYCFYCYSVKVIDSWCIKHEVYEETFDSQSMDYETFVEKMNIRLKGYNDNKDINDENYGIEYKLGSDEPRYYEMADEKKMEGCNTVSFIASCSDGGNLAEGSFNWKENGNQGKSLQDPKSKNFAMRNSQETNEDEKELLEKQQQYTNEINALNKQISQNDAKMQDIIDKISQAKLAGNTTLVNQLRNEYDALDEKNTQLKQQVNVARQNLEQIEDAIDAYYSDKKEELDGDYRIPSNMQELQGMYRLQWTDEGEWVNGSGEYIFVRHAKCPSIGTEVTYTATLKLARKPEYVLGIRIHRAILSVDFKLSSHTDSENEIEVMQLDMNKSEQERTEEVNKRLKELMADYPDCSIRVNYQYSSKVEDDDDDEFAIHLLWAGDRLAIARNVESQLYEIYGQLVFLEEVLDTRETLLDFFMNRILEVVTRNGRGGIARLCLERWENAGIIAMQKDTVSNKGNGLFPGGTLQPDYRYDGKIDASGDLIESGKPYK